MANKLNIALCILLFAGVYSIFILSPVQQPADSLYSMMVSQSILRHGTVKLDQYQFPGLTPVQLKKYHSNSSIYQLDLIGGHVYYYYSPGSSVLSVPYVALMNARGIYASSPDGTHDPNGEMKIQTGLASLLMAALAVVFYLASRLVLPISWSFAIAIAGTLGTQIWSTATRALWAHTWMIFLLGFIVLMLIGHETKGRRLRPIALATLLSWMFFVRPTAIGPIIVVTAFMLFYERERFLRYAVTGACWLLLFVIYSWHNFGEPVPSYYRLGAALEIHSLWLAILGNLISPSRGLLVFVPSLLFVAYLLVRYWNQLPSRRLVILSLAAIGLHLILVSTFPIWWAGWSFGPRFFTDVVPWFVLLAIMGVSGMLTAHERRPLRVPVSGEVVAGAMLLVLSIVIHARGATSPATAMWNARPSVDDHPERVWDWRDPQFLAR